MSIDTYTFLKIFHIISVVFWFFLLFSISRNLILFSKLENDTAKKTVAKLLGNLYGKKAIPLMILSWCTFIGFLAFEPSLMKKGFVHLKLTLVIYVTIYHHIIGLKAKKVGKGQKVSIHLPQIKRLEIVTFIVFILLVFSGVLKF